MRQSAAIALLSVLGVGGAAQAAEVCADLLAHAEPASPGRERQAITADDILRLRDFGQLPFSTMPSPFALSPDGRSIALIIRRAEPQTNALCLGVVVMAADGSGGRIVDRQSATDTTDAGYAFSARAAFRNPFYLATTQVPHWSPNGDSVAFLRRDGGASQLWLAKADGTGSRRLSTSPVDIETFTWRSDGGGLIYASRPALLEANRKIADESRWGAHVDAEFRALPPNGARRVPPTNLPLAYTAVDVLTGDERPAAPAERQMLIDATSVDPRLGPVRVRSDGVTAQVVRDATGFLASPRRLTVKTASGAPIACDAPACRDVAGVWWIGKDLYFTRLEGWALSKTALYQWRPGRQAPRRIFATDDVVAGCQALGRRLICAREGATTPRRLVAIDPGSGHTTVLFDPNPQVGQWNFGAVERLTWSSARGTPTFGDLVLPPDHRPGQRHPLVVVTYESRGFLRGGTGDEYPIHAFAARGFAVLSFERPKDVGLTDRATSVLEVERANLADFADRRNVQSALENGVRLTVARGVVDPARVGVTGLSEGSAIAQWALINSKLFAAAAISSGPMGPGVLALSDTRSAEAFQSFGYPKLAADDRAFWRPLSLDMNIEAIRTPVLYNLPESEYLLAMRASALARELGRPLDLFVFANEQHFKWQPAHRQAIYDRNLDWFDFWLRGVASTSPERSADLARWRAWRATLDGSAGDRAQ